MAKSLAQRKADAKRQGWLKYVRTENDERALVEGCYIHTFKNDPLDWRARGGHFVEFCKRFIKLSKGRWAGKSFDPMDWQRDEIMVPLFGWRRPDGRRRFKKMGCWVPKKNAKSTMSALVLVYMLRTEPGNPELYTVANDRNQARIVFNVAADMVRASPELARDFIIRASTNVIRYGTSSWIRALSADHSTAEGLDALCVIVDELHAFDERGRKLLSALEYSGRARDEPLQVVISTAGDDMTRVGYQEYQYAKAVADGSHVDTRFLSVIHEADPNDDWEDVATFRKSNPSAGVILQDADYLEAVTEAKGSPRKIADVQRYLLNIWVKSSTPWLDMKLYDACLPGPPDADLVGRECWAGIDAGSTRDLSALALVWPWDDGGIVVRVWFWCSEQPVSDRARNEREGYTDFVKRGLIDTTAGDAVDTHAIRDKLRSLRDDDGHYIRQVGYDPYNMKYTAQDIQDHDHFETVHVPQGIVHLSEATKRLETLIEERKFHHDGDVVLRWCADNATVIHDKNDNIRCAKPEPGSKQKIDGVSATINALALIIQANRLGGSVYEDRGIIFV